MNPAFPTAETKSCFENMQGSLMTKARVSMLLPGRSGRPPLPHTRIAKSGEAIQRRRWREQRLCMMQHQAREITNNARPSLRSGCATCVSTAAARVTAVATVAAAAPRNSHQASVKQAAAMMSLQQRHPGWQSRAKQHRQRQRDADQRQRVQACHRYLCSNRRPHSRRRRLRGCAHMLLRVAWRAACLCCRQLRGAHVRLP